VVGKNPLNFVSLGAEPIDGIDGLRIEKDAFGPFRITSRARSPDRYFEQVRLEFAPPNPVNDSNSA
jgi:hypothetical protein